MATSVHADLDVSSFDIHPDQYYFHHLEDWIMGLGGLMVLVGSVHSMAHRGHTSFSLGTRLGWMHCATVAA